MTTYNDFKEFFELNGITFEECGFQDGFWEIEIVEGNKVVSADGGCSFLFDENYNFVTVKLFQYGY